MTLDLNNAGTLGLVFVLAFLILIIFFAVSGRDKPRRPLREIRAFTRLGRSVGLAVEAGKRLHITLGRGGVFGLKGASSLIGLSILERISRTASISDRPPIATSGEGTQTILSQDTMRSTLSSMGVEDQYDPSSGQLSGITPFSYAAGTIPVNYEDEVAATVVAGHFGSEVALITDSSERNASTTIGGSDSLPAQAILYASAEEPLLGEELYAAGAYLKAGPMHSASLRAQDILRWVLVLVILIGAILKFLGLL